MKKKASQAKKLSKIKPNKHCLSSGSSHSSSSSSSSSSKSEVILLLDDDYAGALPDADAGMLTALAQIGGGDIHQQVASEAKAREVIVLDDA